MGRTAAESTPISLTGAINFSSNFYVQTPLTMTLNATEPSTVTGALSGGLSLVAGGPSTLTLSNANSYSGGTTISGGTLAITNAAGLGYIGGGLAIGPATLEVSTM